MLEYLAYRKIKKHKAAKRAKEDDDAEEARSQAGDEPRMNRIDSMFSEQETGTSRALVRRSSSSDRPPLPTRPILDRSDESFLANILADHDGPSPSAPGRAAVPDAVPDIEWSSDDAASVNAKKSDDPKGKKKKKEDKKLKEKEKKEKDSQKPGRLSMLFSKAKKGGDKDKDKAEDGATNTGELSEEEVEKEKMDLNSVLNRLNLTAKNNKVVPLPGDSAELLQKFTQIFKDLANGVPTAYDDLVKLIDDRDGTLNRGFEKLPPSLQKLVTQLPDKVTNSIAPEILAAAAKSQGIDARAEGGLKGTAQKMFVPQNIMEMVTKPGALVGMLKAIVGALKTRWPAFIGVNVLWSVALMLLMFVLWYCYKRGREVRLENEKNAGAVDGSSRIEELPDDPQLPAPSRSGTYRRGDSDNEYDESIRSDRRRPRNERHDSYRSERSYRSDRRSRRDDDDRYDSSRSDRRRRRDEEDRREPYKSDRRSRREDEDRYEPSRSERRSRREEEERYESSRSERRHRGERREERRESPDSRRY